MPSGADRQRLETAAIVVGYAMSRMDSHYLATRGVKSWRKAFEQAGQALSVRPASLKNLRDEFDPIHSNRRAGWHAREMRPNRRRVLEELSAASDEALAALVDRILARDSSTTDVALDSLAPSNRIAQGVAERLLTGRRAEDYFLENCAQILGVTREALTDYRFAARGFDFGVGSSDTLAVEVKGLKETRGMVLFTDHEWSEARCRRDAYILVVVGNLARVPRARVIRDPHGALQVSSVFRSSITTSWTSRLSVEDAC